MYRHARSVLEECLSQYPVKLSLYHSKSLSNEASADPGPKSPGDKAAPTEIRIRTVKIHKGKRAQDVPKEKVFFLYALLCNRLVNPFLDLIIPGIKSEGHLSNLTDFRKGHWPIAIHSKGGDTCLSKCLEEPSRFKLKKALEIEDCVIKDPKLVFNDRIKRKVDFFRVFSANFNSLIHRAKGAEEHRISCWYKIFLKRWMDLKIENLTPNICGGSLGKLRDFRAHDDDDFFSFGHSKQEVKTRKNPLTAQSFSSTAELKRDTNEDQIEYEKTYSPPLLDENLNVLITHEQAVRRKVTQSKNKPKPRKPKRLDVNQISEKYDNQSLKSGSSIKLLTSSKPQIKLDQASSAQTTLIKDSYPVSGNSSKLSEDSKVFTNETKQTTLNDIASMTKVISFKKENVLEKAEIDKKLQTAFKLEAKKRFTCKTTREKNKIKREVTHSHSDDNKQSNINDKVTSLQIISTDKINTRDEIEKIDKVKSKTGQSNQKNIGNAEFKTYNTTVQTEKQEKRNKLHSNSVSTKPTKVRKKLEHQSKILDPTGNKIKGKNAELKEIDMSTSKVLGESKKLKKALDKNRILSENKQLVEDVKSKTKLKLVNSPNKPMFAVKQDLENSQIDIANNNNKTQGTAHSYNPPKAKLVTFISTEEESYFVTKDKNLKGVQSDLINIKNVIESEERFLKSQNSISAQHEMSDVKHSNSIMRIEENGKQVVTAKNLRDIDLKSKINKKSKSVEDLTKGLISRREKMEVSPNHLKFDVFKSSLGSDISNPQNLKNKDKKVMSKEIKASNSTEVCRGLKLSKVGKSDIFRESKSLDEKKPNFLREFTSLNKISMSKVLDSNFESNKEDSKNILTSSVKTSGKLLLSNSNVKVTLKVPNPRIYSKKEGINVIKDKQKETFSEISKKRDEKFSFLKNESHAKVELKNIEVINKKIPRRNLEVTTKRSVSENRLTRDFLFNKTENDKLQPNKITALQNLNMDKVENHNAIQGEKETVHVWNSKSVDQIASLKESLGSGWEKSSLVLEKNANSPVAKVSSVLPINPVKVTNVDTQPTVLGIKTVRMDNQSKTSFNLQQSSKQQTTQLEKNKSSNLINTISKKTPGSSIKKGSIDNEAASLKISAKNGSLNNVEGLACDEKLKINKCQEIKSSTNISNTKLNKSVDRIKPELSTNTNNVSKDEATELTKVNGQSKSIKTTKISEQTVLNSKGEKLIGKCVESKFEEQNNNLTQKEEKNKVSELKIPLKNLKTRNLLQKPSENSIEIELTKSSKEYQLFGKGQQSIFQVERNDNMQREEKNKDAGLVKIPPNNLETGDTLQKPYKNLRGNESSQNSKVGTPIGKGEQKNIEVKKHDHIKREEKNKVAELTFQRINLKTENVLLKVSEKLEGNISTKNSKEYELIGKCEQSKFAPLKNDTSREEKNKIGELKLQQPKLKKEHVLHKTLKDAKGNESDIKISEGKFHVPKCDYGKNKESKYKAVDIKVNSMLTVKNKPQDTSNNSKVEIGSRGKSDEIKLEKPPKSTQREVVNTTDRLITLSTNLKPKNVPQQTNTKGENSPSITGNQSQTLEKNKEVYYKVSKMDYSLKKESKSEAKLQVQSMTTKQQHFSQNTTNSFQNLSTKKSGSSESIVGTSKKQLGEFGGIRKTTLDKNIPHILQMSKSVVNKQKVEPRTIVSDLNINESANKHRPIAKISAPVLPIIKRIAEAKLSNKENKINGKVQIRTASSDEKKCQEVRDGDESRSNITMERKVRGR